MKLFRLGWPKLGPKLEPLEGISVIIGCKVGVEFVRVVVRSCRASGPGSAIGDAGVVDEGVADCPETEEAGGVESRGAVVGRRDRVWIESAVVGLKPASADAAEDPSPRGRSSVRVDSRLVTLSQLTGRTRVLACVRGTAAGMGSTARDRVGSLDDKAAFSLLRRVPTFLSPGTEAKDFLLSESCGCA